MEAVIKAIVKEYIMRELQRGKRAVGSATP